MNKEKLNKNAAKSIETKRKIYETGEQLFTKYGFDSVSVDSIVEMAGVSKGTFYVHFDSKDSLIAALINDYVNNLDLDYKSYLESSNVITSASDTLISLTGKITDIITNTIGYDNMKTIYRVQLTKTINTDAIMSYIRELYKIFNDLITTAMHQGEFTTVMPVDTLTKHCIMAIRGLTYEWCVRYPDFDLKEQAVKHFKILLEGIKK